MRSAKSATTIRPARAACALAAAIALGATLAGCGSAPKRSPAIERDSQASAPQRPGARALPRPGGYYQDDGPGDNPPDLDRIADARPRVEPLHRFANNAYSVFGQQYAPFQSLRPYRQRGIASWYGRKFHGSRTSSGEPYDMYAMTGAHPLLPIPSFARVTNLATGKSVIVRINDRGPFLPGRLIDLSYAAAWKLGFAETGAAMVEVEAVLPGQMPAIAARGGERDGATASAPAAITPAGAAPAARPAETGAPAPPIPVAVDGTGVYLQLGAFAGRDNAENFRVRIYGQLSWLNQAIEILQKDGVFRLHLGPYRDRREAAGVAERIRAALELQPVFVIR